MKSKVQSENQRHALRLCKVLSKRLKTGCPYLIDNESLIVAFGEKQYRFTSSIIIEMKKQKLITVANNNLKLTDAGVAYLKQALNPDGLLASSQNVVETAEVIVNHEYQQVQINMNESPLMRLFTRKTKAGSTYISMEEFQAGERLRKDFERGQLQPKITASLHGSIGSSSRSGFSDVNDIADFALDARNRVGNAIEKLGPELSGVTLDICCFLKGLESVERERRWPPRSAKLMLKTALSLLAKHYGIAGYENRPANRSYSWGSADYRPSIDA